MRKPTIEVECDMMPEDTLKFRNDPYDTDEEVVWVEVTGGIGKQHIRMTCERARALGEALLKVYGNDEEPTKNITI